MSDPWLIVVLLIMHVGIFIGVEMVSGCDRQGKGYAATAIRTKQHLAGLAAVCVATALMLIGTASNSLLISVAIAGLLLLDVYLIFRAFTAAKAARRR
ncbi:MAG: hypothetical protein LH610_02510 [Sphingomonas bacterium]|nr:hypothetical protein [Sphingomonas bacterium]